MDASCDLPGCCIAYQGSVARCCPLSHGVHNSFKYRALHDLTSSWELVSAWNVFGMGTPVAASTLFPCLQEPGQGRVRVLLKTSAELQTLWCGGWWQRSHVILTWISSSK